MKRRPRTADEMQKLSQEIQEILKQMERDGLAERDGERNGKPVFKLTPLGEQIGKHPDLIKAYYPAGDVTEQ